MSTGKLGMGRMLAYGIGDIYGGGSFFVIGSLYLVFLTDVAGLSPVLAGTVLMAGKFWDALTDPLMGWLSDHTKSRHGRRRVYFLAGIAPVFLTFAMLWWPAAGAETLRFVYYLLAYMAFTTVFTMVMIPYNSMPAEMATSYPDRSKLMGIRMFFSQLGVLAGALLAKTLTGLFSDPAEGYRAMGLIFGAVYALPWIIVFLGSFERELPPAPSPGTLKNAIGEIAGEFLSTWKNRSLRVHIGMYLTAYLTIDIFNALFIYFLKDYLDKENLYQILLGTVILTQMASLILVARGCSRAGNGPTYRRHLLVWGLGFLLFAFLVPASPLPLMIISALLIGAGMSGGAMVPYNMLAFVSDADELISTRRREGIYAGMMTFVRKAAQALALFLVGLGLEALGYVSGGDGGPMIQTRDTAEGIRLMMIILPGILLAAGYIFSLSFHIDTANHATLLAEIQRRKSGGYNADMDPATREICEKITGLESGRLWGGQ